MTGRYGRRVDGGGEGGGSEEERRGERGCKWGGDEARGRQRFPVRDSRMELDGAAALRAVQPCHIRRSANREGTDARRLGVQRCCCGRERSIVFSATKAMRCR